MNININIKIKYSIINCLFISGLSLLLINCAATKSTTYPNKDSGPGFYDVTAPRHNIPDGAFYLPDSFLVPEAGCPAEYTLCGTVCAKLSDDFRHCGSCDFACKFGTASQCQAGRCVCGSGGAACGAGLNCLNGQCECIPNGECLGCCSGNICLARGSGQSSLFCGKNGAVCKSCQDTFSCTDDACLASGDCQINLRPGTCLISQSCFDVGATDTSNACHYCDPDQSSTDWSSIPCVTKMAGNESGTAGYANGPSTLARFSSPHGLLLEDNGNLIIVDSGNNRLRQLSKGIVSTIAGNGAADAFDGLASTSSFNYPMAIASDSNGQYYVADCTNSRIRQLSKDTNGNWLVTTIAGSSAGHSDGEGASVRFGCPTALAVDKNGVIYVADYYKYYNGGWIRNMYIRSLAKGTSGIFATATIIDKGTLTEGYGLALDSKNNLFVTDTETYRIYQLSKDTNNIWKAVAIAGAGVSGSNDGPGVSATFSYPETLAIDKSDRLYVIDNNQLRQIAKDTSGTWQVSTLTGNYYSNEPNYAQVPATLVRLTPNGLAVDATGNKIYISDNHIIRLYTR